MFIPIGTDAPIYHFPFATIGLIVANVVIYIVTASIAIAELAALPAPDQPLPAAEQLAEQDQPRSILSLSYSPWIKRLTLEFDRINPVQWFTHNFMHADIIHLLGNMIFLWGFGLVVEGKLGWWRFLTLYFVLCFIQGALVQVPMYFLATDYGLALGASGAIFALMAISVVWAPQNELQCVLFLRFYPMMIEISIIIFGFIYLAIQLVFFAIGGFGMSSEALHLVGLFTGLAAGSLYLKKGWVDCEGWDIHSVYFASEKVREKRRTRMRDQEKEEELREIRKQRKDELSQVIGSIQGALDAGQDKAAIAIFLKCTAQLNGGQKLPANVLAALVSAMHREKQWTESIPLLVLLLRQIEDPHQAVGARLKLAQILIQVAERPKQAMIVMEKLPETLTTNQTAKRKQLTQVARAMMAEGNFEVDVHDW